MKPPALQYADQKLSFAPFGHLKKYRLDDSPAAGQAVEATAVGNRRSDTNPITTRYVGVSDLPSTVPALACDVISRPLVNMSSILEAHSKKRGANGTGSMGNSFIQLPVEGIEEKCGSPFDKDVFISANTGLPGGKKGKRVKR